MQKHTVLYVLIQLIHGGDKMIVLNPTDSRPLYEQITEKLKDLIIGGYLKENDRIPSVRELAGGLSINPNTIQKAYKNLEAEGYIYSKTAKGYFVSATKKNNERILILEKQLDEIVKEMSFIGADKETLLKVIKRHYKD